jgi:hypothetical protein
VDDDPTPMTGNNPAPRPRWALPLMVGALVVLLIVGLLQHYWAFVVVVIVGGGIAIWRAVSIHRRRFLPPT